MKFSAINATTSSRFIALTATRITILKGPATSGVSTIVEPETREAGAISMEGAEVQLVDADVEIFEETFEVATVEEELTVVETEAEAEEEQQTKLM